MKVFALVLLVVASVAAKGSGPYLPSGWKPQGPAFYLPSEAKPSANPIEDVILEESEASGSDFLREYGPPDVVVTSQNVINQGLPDAVTELTFVAAAVDVQNEDVLQAVEAAEAEVEQTSGQSVSVTEILAEETTVASAPVDEIEKIVEISQTTVANGEEAVNVEAIFQDTTESVEVGQLATEVAEVTEVAESNVGSESAEVGPQATDIPEVAESGDESQSSSVDIESQTVPEPVSQESSQESTSVDQEVKQSGSQSDFAQVVDAALENIKDLPEILESLEQVAKVQQSELSEGDRSEFSKTSGELGQVIEGFLEYGPPEFSEYGPPKDSVSEEQKSEETNEARRRRFSPKFRPAKKH